MNRPNKLYLVWDEENDFYEQFDSIEDAVLSKGTFAEVFEATVKPLGIYKSTNKIEKVSKKELKQWEKGEQTNG